ncbi:hypothetical protein D9619_012469 [Psilocybe cf. subviscida]|uniref:RNA helicase n=1 Tax=Psilocybe cf. subviscida TaxID=2480587 RepID=A0A8H5ERL0_9AGAR|nr:hypothetical protein D9619_012469 [Psilocybe cf. subviscida]
MSSLLSQCLHTSGNTRSVQHVVSLFHTSAAVRAARGRRNNKESPSASAPPPPPRPEFQRDGLPHEGRTPVVSGSRAPRQFDANGRAGRRTAAKGPLASPSAVARREGRDGGSRDRVRSREGGFRDAGQVRGRERGGDKRGAARYGGEGESERGTRRNYDGGGGGGERERERSHSPPSSFHRSVERASRENYRMAKQLDRVKFDNEHEFGGASSPRRAGTSTSTNTNTNPSTGAGTSRPWRNYDAAADAASHPEPRRDFSDFDRPLKEGAYDAPELKDEFFHPLDAVSPISDSAPSPLSTKGKQRLSEDTAVGFTSPPLMPGLVSSLHEVLGRDARPTPIQALSIKHLLGADSKPADVPGAPPGWRQFLLASETGSGKSIAYLLPLLQGVKQAELAAQIQAQTQPLSDSSNSSPKPKGPQRLYNPRGLIMAPTHELARQLSVFAKGLLRGDDVKLRVLCASRANVASTAARPGSGQERSNGAYQTEEQEQGKAQGHPVDVVVGTPMKLLEMVRGRGFDALDEAGALARAEEEIERDERAREAAAADEEGGGGDQDGKKYRKVRRGRDRVVHFGKWKSGAPELGLKNVEWVVVDEADVLFDPDFQETTRALLADISAARGVALPASASSLPSPSPPSTHSSPSSTPPAHPEALAYPFNLILTSATIPKALNAYLARFHPRMLRLASPRLHKLPKALQTEYVGWTGGNKFADVMRRLRQVWAEDAAASNASPPPSPSNVVTAALKGGKEAVGKRTPVELTKILVFCNKSAKVAEFAAYLEQHGIKSVALTSGAGGQRLRGSNGHLSGFLKDTKYTKRPWSRRDESASASTDDTYSDDVKKHAHVMVTTSLLSRGLDFTPSVKHVFIVDEPRNTVDFIHRAGRTGRAGERGKVVIFGKMAGRGSARTKEIRRRVSVLTKA